MIDESRENGIDDDGDWNPEKDDVGIDGLPNTGDQGENDGVPSAGNAFDIRQPGEPNFEWTDLDESDMIGLTSFAAPNFGGNNRISKDEIGLQINLNKIEFLGLFRHHYINNFIDDKHTTNYFNIAYVYFLEDNEELNIKMMYTQHNKYLWIPINKIQKDDRIHKNVKA